VLIYLEGIGEVTSQDAEAERVVRAALVSSGQYEPRSVFPDYFGGPEQDQEEPVDANGEHDDSDVDFDYSAVTWEVPSEMGDDEMALLRQVMGDNSNVGVVEDQDFPEVDKKVDLGFVPDEREWV
jgi:hypothetical protein